MVKCLILDYKMNDSINESWMKEYNFVWIILEAISFLCVLSTNKITLSYI